MMSIKQYHTLAVFQQFQAVDVVHSSRICCTLSVGNRGKLHGHHAPCMVVVIVFEQLYQCAAVPLIDIEQIVV